MNGKPDRPFTPSRGPRHTGDCLETSRVIDTRYRGQGVVYRWRECLKCRTRFATHEVSLDELERLRAIARVQAEIVELADSIYANFGPKPDDLNKGAAADRNADTPVRNEGNARTTDASPLSMRAAA